MITLLRKPLGSLPITVGQTAAILSFALPFWTAYAILLAAVPT